MPPLQLPAAVIALFLTAPVFAAEPFEGHWHLALEKSKLDAGLHVRKIDMTISKIGENTFRTTQDITTFESGETRHQESDRILDGREHVVANGLRGTEIRTITARRIDSNTRHIVDKTNGKETERVISVVAADGKSMKNIEHEATGNRWVSVYER